MTKFQERSKSLLMTSVHFSNLIYHHTHLSPRAVPKPVRTTYQSQNMLCAFSHKIFPLVSFILKSYSTLKAQIKLHTMSALPIKMYPFKPTAPRSTPWRFSPPVGRDLGPAGYLKLPLHLLLAGIQVVKQQIQSIHSEKQLLQEGQIVFLQHSLFLEPLE